MDLITYNNLKTKFSYYEEQKEITEEFKAKFQVNFMNYATFIDSMLI